MLIIGLGNPGSDYVMTRHNLGFMVVDCIAKKYRFPEWQKRNRSKVSKGSIGGREVILAKPQTFMNLSGNAALSLMTTFKITAEKLIVVVDDLALPFGKIRFRPGGSDGGHKGLASIIDKIGRNDFPRLRVGIGNPEYEEEVTDYVLSKFSPDEIKQIPGILEKCVEGLETIVSENLNAAMNKYN